MNQKTAPSSIDPFLAAAAAGIHDRHAMTLADAMPQIVWTANPDGSVDDYNRHWIAYTGLTIEQTQAGPALYKAKQAGRNIGFWTAGDQAGK